MYRALAWFSLNSWDLKMTLFIALLLFVWEMPWTIWVSPWGKKLALSSEILSLVSEHVCIEYLQLSKGFTALVFVLSSFPLSPFLPPFLPIPCSLTYALSLYTHTQSFHHSLPFWSLLCIRKVQLYKQRNYYPELAYFRLLSNFYVCYFCWFSFLLSH